MRPGDDLAQLLRAALPKHAGLGDVLVVSHKVVSKAEGRIRTLHSIEAGSQAIQWAIENHKDARVIQAVLDESQEVLRASNGVLICETHSGLVCANAGVDQSNVGDDEVVLLPVDGDESARRLRAGLGNDMAVVIADSFGRAWRVGQTDVAVGCAGLVPLDTWEGRADANGRTLYATEIAVADAIAGAADLARAKDSWQPAVIVRGLERFVTKADGPGALALRRPAERDLFR